MIKKFLYMLAVSSFLILTACGGSDNPPPSNNAVWDTTNWDNKNWQ
ncbi:MAG: hypothetical protein KAU21_13825 [Gammaproteobacteria bacterium]|nr:hypothetical protein [Gammaproteobacteria bacterium]